MTAFIFCSRIPVVQRLKHEISFKINGVGADKPVRKGIVDILDLYCFLKARDQFYFYGITSILY